MSRNILEFTDHNFATEVESGTGITVVDFWAPWCGPCRFVAPLLEQLADEYGARVRIGKLNVDENPAVAGRYGIRSIPTVGIFRDGEPVGGVVGAVPKTTLQAAIDEQLAA
jgi:thioredoxin 1